jgi:hypothetical protein
MPVEESLNKILKEMWQLDEKLGAGEELSQPEKEFYNAHLTVIVNYYAISSNYWNSKETL